MIRINFVHIVNLYFTQQGTILKEKIYIYTYKEGAFQILFHLVS